VEELGLADHRVEVARNHAKIVPISVMIEPALTTSHHQGEFESSIC
jgi:hypothetical protein